MASLASVLDSFLFPEITPTVTPNHARTSTVSTPPIITRKHLLSPISQVGNSSLPLSFARIVAGHTPVAGVATTVQEKPSITDLGGRKAVKISQAVYNERVASRKFLVIGRITLAR